MALDHKNQITTALVLANTSGPIECAANHRELRAVYRETAKHEAEIRGHGYKGALVTTLTARLVEHALKETDHLTRTTYGMIHAKGRSADAQAYFEGVANDLLEQNRHHLLAIIETSVANMAKAESRDVLVSQKRWWQR